MVTTYTVRDPENFRANVRTKIAELFAHDPEAAAYLPTDDCDRDNNPLFVNIEKSLFNWAVREAKDKQSISIQWDSPNFVQLYVDRLRSIYRNLTDCRAFMLRVARGEVPPERVGFMSHQEMNPERWDDIVELKKMRDASKYQSNLVANTDLYKCSRCRSTKCNYTTQQVRSADEAMTVFVTCLSCGKQWKC
jgi:DNA-directed RNA polymerase subunit M/transcription elongation factor TFIIS